VPLWPAGIDSIMIACSQAEVRTAAGRSDLASFWVDAITARAPLSSRMCW
jgi:hypothetical protein